MLGIDISTCWSDPNVGFRYDPEAQLKLLQDNPEIDPDKWTPIRQWTGQLLEALPSLELAEIVVAAR